VIAEVRNYFPVGFTARSFGMGPSRFRPDDSGIGIWDDVYATQSKKWRGVEKVAVGGVGFRETVNSRASKVKGVCGAEKSGRGCGGVYGLDAFHHGFA
jgi:hypothetical protein